AALQIEPVEQTTAAPAVLAPVSTLRSGKVCASAPIPPAPYLERRVRDVKNLGEVWSYINPFMLFGRHLGYKGNFEQDLARGVPKAIELNAMVDELQCEAARIMKVKAMWQFFEAERAGNSIRLFAPGAATPLHTFHFGRQPRPGG